MSAPPHCTTWLVAGSASQHALNSSLVIGLPLLPDASVPGGGILPRERRAVDGREPARSDRLGQAHASRMPFGFVAMLLPDAPGVLAEHQRVERLGDDAGGAQRL